LLFIPFLNFFSVLAAPLGGAAAAEGQGALNALDMDYAVLPGAGIWRRAWDDGAHCPCAARHAAGRFKDQIFAGAVRFSK
jgi:hypothetical protein